MKLKICGLNNESNIQKILRLKPDYLGFIFYNGSPRAVKPDINFGNFVQSINGIAKVGVFVDEQYEIIIERILDYGLDYIQLHGKETPEFCRALNNIAPVIKSFPISNDFDFKILDAYVSSCSYLLFDTPSRSYGGSGQSFDWHLLRECNIPLPFFLSGGIGPGDTGKVKAFRHPSLFAVDINSRFEMKEGIKNINLLKQFTNELFYK